MAKNKVSIVLPCYNEEDVLQDTVEKVTNILEGLYSDYELIIVEDGCTDKTPEIAKDLASENEEILHLHFDSKLGKGKAIMKGFSAASYHKLLFMDSDLATDLGHIESFIDKLDRYPIVIGSRYKEGAESERDFRRKFFSKNYNRLVKLMFSTGVKDHQCGFKAIRKETFEEIKPELSSDHWFWDTELVIKARQKEIPVKELSVNWDEKGSSEVDIGPSILHFGKKLLHTKIG